MIIKNPTARTKDSRITARMTLGSGITRAFKDGLLTSETGRHGATNEDLLNVERQRTRVGLEVHSIQPYVRKYL
jgi:hypothetical protein